MIAIRILAPLLALSGLAAPVPALAVDWGLIGEYRASGQIVFVDADSLKGDAAAVRSVEVLAVFARDIDKDAGYRFTAEMDCAAGKLRARDARTFDADGRELARDGTVGAWGDPAGLAFGERLIAYACKGEEPPAKLLGDAPPIALARRHFADPKAAW